MVIVKCSECGEVLLKKDGFDIDTSNMKCPKCGSEKTDVDIEC